MAARPRKQLATVDDDGNVIDPAAPLMDDSIDSAEGPSDIALETALMQIGQETENAARVIIYRFGKENGKTVEYWLHETTPADFSEGGLAWIAKEWGGGTYRVRIFVPGEVGFRSNKVIRLAEPKGTEQAATSAQSSGLGELANVMMQGFQKLGELIVGQQKPAATEEDMLRKMAMYKELFAPAYTPRENPASPMESVSTMMEMFKQGMELGRMGGGEPSSMDALMKGLEVFGPVVQQAMEHQATKAPAPVAPAAPVHHLSAPEETDVNVRAMMLKQSLSFLVSQARKGADPYTYANVVLDQLDETEVKALMDNPQWLEWLKGINAEIGAPNVSSWFVQLREEIRALLTSEENPGIDGAHATIENAITATPVDVAPGGNS